MKCAYHNEREAEYTCQSCGRPLCRECVVNTGGTIMCRACSHYMQYGCSQPNKGDGVNGFLFFIYLLVPGLRHMYIGFMKRGLQFLAAFFGLIAFSTMVYNSEGLTIPLILIIWFYSAFDSYNYRKLKAAGQKLEDKTLLDEYGLTGLKGFFTRHRPLVGVLIIIWGVYLLLKQIVVYGWNYRFLPSAIVRSIDFALGSIIPVLFIIGGVYLITRVGKKKPAGE